MAKRQYLQKKNGQMAGSVSYAGFEAPTAPSASREVRNPFLNEQRNPGSQGGYSDVYEAYSARTRGFSAVRQQQERCPWCGKFGNTHVACRQVTLDQTKASYLATRGFNKMAGLGVLAGVASGVALAASISPVLMGVVVAASLALAFREWRWAKNPVTSEEIDSFREENRERRKDTVGFTQAEREVGNLCKKLGVRGEVIVRLSNSAVGASAVRFSDTVSAVTISAQVLDLPTKEREGVLAHEVAHLQPPMKSQVRRFMVDSVAFPAATLGAAAAGGMFLPAAVAGGSLWAAVKLFGLASSRREERRADREAYRLCGENFPKALARISEETGVDQRRNLPFRLEDAFSQHGTVENRLADMRKSPGIL